MKKITHNVAIRLLGAMLASFWLVYLAVGAQQTANIASSLLLALATIMGFQLMSTAWHIIRGKSQDEGAVLILGLFVLAVGIIENRSYTLYYRWLDRPDWLLHVFINPLGPWVMAGAIGIILLARGTVRGKVPFGNLVYVLIGTFLGGVIAGASVFFVLQKAPDLSFELDAPLNVPGIGAIICTNDQPIRVRAYCRARPRLFDVTNRM